MRIQVQAFQDQENKFGFFLFTNATFLIPDLCEGLLGYWENLQHFSEESFSLFFLIVGLGSLGS
jgi:hypothetical protein